MRLPRILASEGATIDAAAAGAVPLIRPQLAHSDRRWDFCFGSEAEIQTEACAKMGLRGDRQNYGGTGPEFETCAAQADSAMRF